MHQRHCRRCAEVRTRPSLVYVADRENRRVQMFTSDGKFLKQYVRHNAPFARNVALSPDAQQRFL